MNGIDFDIKTGERVAIVGGSGSGKSTLAKLLFRFYDPDQGQILINNHDLRDCQLSSIRDLIGVVPQDCGKFYLETSLFEKIKISLKNLKIKIEKNIQNLTKNIHFSQIF